MKKSVIISVLVLMLTSCVSFERKTIKDDLSIITEQNISMIDGQYEFKGYEHVNAGNKKSLETRDFAGMMALKNTGIADCDKVIIQSTSLKKKRTYEFDFKLSKNDSVKYAFKYQGKLKNGLVTLSNYTSKCHGIPFLFGGCQSFQSRIGLTDQKNLLIQDYYDNSGAALLIMWAGYTINYAEKFKRIQ
ncbi:hypothetical protein MKJ01_00900 [Chryseobacterium sp. SSA4.19]|uniref:hypothetical protein n=1 Tax=Chryseobacterium sp. SSA4.19 TaxID=2919915 RepID=UPI001F4E2D05|nr:hypothetical protein [Chryseobacterium sp. SSA4.19]MCJ8152315.1 hypothetical protein [Chryseobacterium sp. SSA4.19]